MPDIRTTEGREELRREHRLVNLYIPSEVKANLRLALDGLDIAQKELYTALGKQMVWEGQEVGGSVAQETHTCECFIGQVRGADCLPPLLASTGRPGQVGQVAEGGRLMLFRPPGQIDSFNCYRRFLCQVEGSTFVVIAHKRDYIDGRNVLRDIVTKDEMPRGHTLDRGWWEAQGIVNICGYHVFLYIERRDGSSCGPVFPIDNGPFEYMEEERGEDDWYDDREDKPACKPRDRSYAQYIGDMKKEGRWQGDKDHPKYPWRKE